MAITIIIHMNKTGATHIFCDVIQFYLIYKAVGARRMGMAPFPMVCIEDSQRVKKKTFDQQPEQKYDYAAVFGVHLRGSEPNTVMFTFQQDRRMYPHSSTPSWTNTVTNVLPPRKKMKNGNGDVANEKDRCSQLVTSILQQ